MKKLLVILMLVAMASFLFVGCLPSVTPEEEEVVEEEEEEVVEPTSATPVLIDIQNAAGTSIITVTSTSTLYMNKTELGNSILVTGTAPSESLVKIYIDDVAVTAAVGETSTSGLWTVAIAKSGLGDDGVKVMTAKVTEVGLAESAASNSVTFTLDTDPVGFSIAATAAQLGAGVGALSSAIVTGVNPVASIVGVGTTAQVAGTWIITTWGGSGTMGNVTITTGGVTQTYNGVLTGAVFTDVIPGVQFTFAIALAAGNQATITTTADFTTAIATFTTITFDEDVTAAAMTAGTYTTVGDPTTYREATDTGYWTTLTVGSVGDAFTISAFGIADAAGNIGGTAASPITATCTVGAASATLLVP